MATQVKQRICGLVGGLAYVSTADYYNQMNQIVSQVLPGHSSRIHIVSLDIFTYVDLLYKADWPGVIEFILVGVEQLVKTGVDFLLVCSNTGHIAAPQISKSFPNLVFLHIGDAVAYAIKEKKMKKVAFLGSKFTMVSDSCVVERLAAHNLEVVFPQADDIERVHQVIIDELTINVFTEESKQVYLAVMQRLCDEQQVEGIILGCTEIPLLVKQSDFPRVLLFDSTQLHVQLAVDYQLGRCDIDSFLPASIRTDH